VKPHTQRLGITCVALISCIFFFTAGLAFLPHLGVEDDEALFAEGIYTPRSELYSIRIGQSDAPIMLMSYVGALKSWIYEPIFGFFGAGVLTLRVPMLLAGTGSVWLFYLLLRRVAGQRAAVIGCVLLAVDSSYLLTALFDWGPVALQHLLLLGGTFMLVRFYQQRGHSDLAWGFFLLGLALWDKALAVWLLSGMGIAAILTVPRQILAVATRRRVAIAVMSFVVGALPLLIYNATNHWVTFRGNFRREPGGIAAKAPVLLATATGQGLFGYLTDEDWQTPEPHRPAGILETVSARISALAGHPRRDLLPYALALAVLLALVARGNDLRAILFALITAAVAWVQMAITVSTGGSVHHTILLWPLPQVVVAVSLASASRRSGRAGIPALAAVLAVSLISSALVMGEYHAMMVRNGGGQSWDDAIFRLSDRLKQIPAQNVLPLDWGIFDSLRLLNQGKLPLANGSDQVTKPEMNAEDREIADRMIAEPRNLYIAHTKAFEFFPGNSAKLLKYAAAAGYRREDVAVIPDSFGRPVYELYRLAKAQ